MTVDKDQPGLCIQILCRQPDRLCRVIFEFLDIRVGRACHVAVGIVFQRHGCAVQKNGIRDRLAVLVGLAQICRDRPVHGVLVMVLQVGLVSAFDHSVIGSLAGHLDGGVDVFDNGISGAFQRRNDGLLDLSAVMGSIDPDQDRGQNDIGDDHAEQDHPHHSCRQALFFS